MHALKQSFGIPSVLHLLRNALTRAMDLQTFLVKFKSYFIAHVQQNILLKTRVIVGGG